MADDASDEPFAGSGLLATRFWGSLRHAGLGRGGGHLRGTRTHCIGVFPILADLVIVKKGDQHSETVSQPSVRLDKVDRPTRL